MKKAILVIVSIFFSLLIHGQVNKTINVTAGSLSLLLTETEKSTITALTITGTIDARDFKTIRDDMPLLAVIDISGTTILAYYGTDGTYPPGYYMDYPPNAISDFTFLSLLTGFSKTSLISITLPTSLTYIGNEAFSGCIGLTSINIPFLVTTIGANAFYNCTGLTSVSIPKSVTSMGAGAFYSCDNLTSIISYSPIPLNLNKYPSVFNGVNKSICILKVPYETTSLYAVADQWKDFINIEEMPGFRLSESTFNLAALAGSTATVDITSNITSNVTWTATSDQDWLIVSPISGSNIKTFTLTAQANTTILTRIASVTITATGIVPQTITITQIGVPVTVNNSAGDLSAILTPLEKSTISSLVLTGTIDARDFKTMRDDMPMLAEIDISGATIVAYSGIEGTGYIGLYYDYPSNTIPDYAFYYRWTGISKTSLSSVQFSSSLTAFGIFAFRGCTRLTSVTIPTLVTTLGYGTFQGCSGLTSIAIPASVTTIGGEAFANCTGLTSITTYAPIPANLSYAFNLINKGNCVLYVPYEATILYNTANEWKDFKNIVEMPGFRLSTTAFNLASTAKHLDSVYITSNVTWTATSNQSWLIANPLTGVGMNTLTLTTEDNSSVLKRLAIVTIASAGVVPQTITITQAGVPKMLNNIAGGLSIALTPIELGAINKLVLTGTIDARDFKTMRDDMPMLAEIDISGTTIIAYEGYPANTIPDYAFYDGETGISKKSLISIQLPPTITAIGDIAFYGCSGLTSISITFLVTTLGYGTFGECTGLTSVNFSNPSALYSIGESAFIYCSGLTTITIPKSVAIIGDVAFYHCTGLTSVSTYANVPIDLGSVVFANVNTDSCILYVPYGTSTLYDTADQWKDFTHIVEMAPNVGLKDLPASDFKVYPNPTKSSLSISTKNTNAYLVEIYTVRGSLVFKASFKNSIDVSKLSRGVYILRISDKNGNILETEKIIKE